MTWLAQNSLQARVLAVVGGLMLRVHGAFVPRLSGRLSSAEVLPCRGGAASSIASDFYEALNKPTCIAAPMVAQSDTAFRILCRRYGVQLAYTQMLHSKNFAAVEKYRQDMWDGLPSDDAASAVDRPLIAQFSGDHPDTLVRAASYIQEEVDAIDVNFGCPQRVAKRGHYGSFLLSEPDLVIKILQTMSTQLSVPITAKIRILPSEQQTIDLVRRIGEAGCQLLTVHGRTKEQSNAAVGPAHWDIIRQIKDSVNIPVVANGGIETYADYQMCLAVTGADGVMSSEGLLENPGIFQRPQLGVEPAGYDLVRRQINFAREYLQLCQTYWPSDGEYVPRAYRHRVLSDDDNARSNSGSAAVRGHLFKLLHRILELPVNHGLRAQLGIKRLDLPDFVHIVDVLDELYGTEERALQHTHGQMLSHTSWYRRHWAALKPQSRSTLVDRYLRSKGLMEMGGEERHVQRPPPDRRGMASKQSLRAFCV